MKNYQYLNLEQKMAKIRKKIPVLIKKFYSDEVEYDFSKLDDIYELMTPALNKYGVNFDIIREHSTQHDEAGDLTYLTVDKDGYWRYEADLELCWINADNPEEKRTVSIHAVGTHEIPDKAKGVAWTYALKYYFRNKFSVRQGSDCEDPDMRGRNLPEASGEEKAPKQAAGRQVPAKEPGRQEKEGAREVKKAPVNAGQKKQQAAAEKRIPFAKKEPEKGTAEKTAEAETAKASETIGAPETAGASEAAKTSETAEAPEMTEEAKGSSGKETAAGPGQGGTAQTAKMQEDGFQAVSEDEEIPFDELDGDGSFMAALNEELGKKEEPSSAYEKARDFVCTFGIFKDKKLGEMLDSGAKGKEGLRWIAKKYKGSDTEMVEAARLLLEEEQSDAGAMAA